MWQSSPQVESSGLQRPFRTSGAYLGASVKLQLESALNALRKPETEGSMRSSFSFCIWLVSLVSCNSIAQETPKYLDPSVSIEQRIDDLLPRMTVAEKVSQISDDWGSVAIPRLKVASLLKTEGLHSQSYSTGATIFPQPIGMAATFDLALIHWRWWSSGSSRLTRRHKIIDRRGQVHGRSHPYTMIPE